MHGECKMSRIKRDHLKPDKCPWGKDQDTEYSVSGIYAGSAERCQRTGGDGMRQAEDSCDHDARNQY